MTSIAVTGATGGIGRAVVQNLREAGESVRVVVRDPSRAPGGDAIEVAVAAYNEPQRLAKAFEGIARVLFVSGGEAADRLDQHRNVVRACSRMGVEHVVYTSFVGANPEATFTFARDHFHTEQALADAGVGYTFLRDSLYLDVLPFLPASDGVIRGPAGNGRLAPVARKDVADVATAVLLDPPSHVGRTYQLTGPALMDLYEIAEQLSRVSGRKISYRPETLEEAYESRAHYGAPKWEVEGWVSSYAAIASGELSACTDDVRMVTGNSPEGVPAWLEAHPEAVGHLVTA